ncbi:SixA phosphatase family protein [Dinghuibacter silviterrae]|uniref:Phosphohistidine phosphatase n=1 Tax=Dinghuibacter silviterrae TaxID=1539049 RepID=A0A4R8DRQ0_9BACT|nr:histidine phosphatase family protein [Dinghuibacter silviterrae]TDW99820.1 phosphohistidine phosphatase [Dinghuibacter silviterrae]
MKSLLVIRHAKSSWEWEDRNDFDRPLNDRGKRDAPMMAGRLLTRAIAPDLLVSSPAKRARKTAELFAAELGMSPDDILFKTELYHAAVATFYEVISGLPAAANTVALFSHNPGITAFVSGLTSVRLDNMPTCGVFAIHVSSSDWADFASAPKEFWFFDYPKSF